MLPVVVAVVRDTAGRVLIARRADHLHQGGLWEFPGGKLEPGETPEAALDRELAEELNIRPNAWRRLLRVPYRYPDKAVLLDVWEVTAFTGTPSGRQGQPLRWVAPQSLDAYPFPPANRPIVRAVQLPACYLITPAPPAGPAPGWLARLERALDIGTRLLQLRHDGPWPAARLALAAAACERAHRHGARVLLNGPPELAIAAGADGVHLAAARVEDFDRADLPAGFLAGASCHDPGELGAAVRAGADFAVLGPVDATASHPRATPLGWPRFAEWVHDLPLPVYALGGLGQADLAAARAARGQGIAAIRGLWSGD